ncbi:hypothetical protein MtrunA17_Chr6g0463981 [Medicago truncatula]|uniref:Transmembrane protein n=1 Tax=Medicago truncatula TaxID=3880 RepID=A0A396HCI5_MEDTR|nr:hypothetical protein MtrunA17_Chr6g0463981 [Medicago truncatula]
MISFHNLHRFISSIHDFSPLLRSRPQPFTNFVVHYSFGLLCIPSLFTTLLRQRCDFLWPHLRR